MTRRQQPDREGINFWNGELTALVDFFIQTYGGQYDVLQMGTGDSPLTIPFYEACGFQRHYMVKNFFTDRYDRSIYECGVQLVDMVYL